MCSQINFYRYDSFTYSHMRDKETLLRLEALRECHTERKKVGWFDMKRMQHEYSGHNLIAKEKERIERKAKI